MASPNKTISLPMPAFDPSATPSFEGMPDLCLARVADFLDRSSQVRLATTSQHSNRVVFDPILVPKRWPLKPAGLLHREEGVPEPTMVFLSPNRNRMAVFYPSVEGNPGWLDVWDVEKGKLGSINCGANRYRLFSLKPVFSPDSEILLVGEVEELRNQRGIVRVASNLSNTERGGLSCTAHRFHDSERVQTITFLDNATISYHVTNELNVKERRVIRQEVLSSDNGEPNPSTIIAFSEPSIIVEPRLELIPNSEVFGMYHNNRSASFVGQQKAIHLLASASHNSFFCYDAANDSTTILSAPGRCLFDLDFSHDGQMLVIPYGNFGADGCLALFDCNVNNTKTIAKGPVVSLRSDQEDDNGGNYEYASFLPKDNAKIVANFFTFSDRRKYQIRVLDLKRRQILSAGWNETTWKCIAGYDVDGHVGSLRVVDNEDDDDDSEPHIALRPGEMLTAGFVVREDEDDAN